MSETTITKPKRKSGEDYKAIADQLLADMRHLETLMQADRIEIDRLRGETKFFGKKRHGLKQKHARPFPG